MSDHPSNQVLFTNLTVRRLIDEAKTRPDLAHAIEGTRLRHSDAGGCARKIGLKVAGYEASDPMDGPGLWVTHLGHLIHEALQADLEKAYGVENVTIEATVGWDDLSASGHLDALIQLPDRRICLELKTMGGFGFDKSVGLNRKAYALNGKPEGPRSSAKLQGALNALAADADELRIGHISLESVSKQLAAKVNFSDEQRILAEWSYPRSVFEPWARAEKRRMKGLLAVVDAGRLPERSAIGDDMKPVVLDPDAARPDWRCSYCAYRDLCSEFGKGEPALPVEVAS